MSASFWERRRTELDLSQRAMALRLGISNSAVAYWEEAKGIPQLPIAKLAAGYEVSESVIERELIVQRRVIEAREQTASK